MSEQQKRPQNKAPQQSPAPEGADEINLEGVTPEMVAFAQLVGKSVGASVVEALSGRRSARRDDPEEEAAEEKSEEEIEADKKRHLGQLNKTAVSLARQMRQKARLESDKPESDRANEYEPELTVQHSWNDRRTRKMPVLKHIERLPKAGDEKTKPLAEGWLLARTASIMDKRFFVQEVILGADGNIYSYICDEVRHREQLLESPHSRKQIQDSSQDIVMPWKTVDVSNFPAGQGLYDPRTNPQPKNFYQVTPASYPLPGFGEGAHTFAEPDIIERGLKDLADEKGLTFPEE